jgi:hypothetical protein
MGADTAQQPTAPVMDDLHMLLLGSRVAAGGGCDETDNIPPRAHSRQEWRQSWFLERTRVSFPSGLLGTK